MNLLIKHFNKLVNDPATSNAPAMIDSRSQQVWTWAEFSILVTKTSHWLLDHGMKPGDSLVTLLPNCVESVLLFYACASEGIRYAPAPVNCHGSLLETLIETVQPKIVVAATFILSHQNETLELLERSNKIKRANMSTDGRFEWLQHTSSIRVHDEDKSNDGKLIITTSGTTTIPKIVQWDICTLMQTAHKLVSCYPFIDATSVFFNSFSMSYLGGYLNGTLVPFIRGSSVVITDPLSGKTGLTMWHDINRFGINVLWQPPSILRLMLDDTLQHGMELYADMPLRMRAVLTGMAPAKLELKQDFEKIFGIPVFENYALTETGFLTAEMPLEIKRSDTESEEKAPKKLKQYTVAKLRQPGSVGQLMDGVEVQFRQVVENSKEQELLVKSNSMADGYLDDSGAVVSFCDHEGFVATGDAGVLVDDEVVLTSRLRDIAKRGELIIYLNDIESVAQTHPEVSAATAVRTDHRLLGESYNLFIQTHDDTDNDAENVISAWLRQVIPSDKWPNRIQFVRRFDRTSAGKIIKHKLM